jgi:hypothetical protein
LYKPIQLEEPGIGIAYHNIANDKIVDKEYEDLLVPAHHRVSPDIATNQLSNIIGGGYFPGTSNCDERESRH